MSTLDETRLEEFMGRIVGYLTGGAASFGIWLGDELGLYRTLADAGPASAQLLADSTACHPKLVREWLDSQAAAGLVDYDATADTYALSPEGVMALSDDTSPVFTARGTNVL